MSKLSAKTFPFQVVGQFMGFVFKDGYQVKYLRIVVENREYWFKPDKNLRDRLSLNIAPNSWLEVTGESRVCEKTGLLKLKVTEIREDLSSQSPAPKPAKQAKATVLVCQKSDCWKKGGAKVCQILEESLQEKGLSETVKIKLTGCLKQCKKGPNVVVMPDKKHYNNVNPQEIPSLIEKHFIPSSEKLGVMAGF